jgi:hypothetical protein
LSESAATPQTATATPAGERRRLERRKHPRYPVSGGAEVRQQGVDSRIWARLTDISLGGCYLEMMSPLPVLTYVNLGLILEEQHLNAKGQVVVSHPNFGMGIQFIDLGAADRKMLESWLAALAPKVVTPLGRRGGENPVRTLDKDSAALLVQAITEFFFNRPVMSREEFQQLVEARHQASKDAEAKAEAPKPA